LNIGARVEIFSGRLSAEAGRDAPIRPDPEGAGLGRVRQTRRHGWRGVRRPRARAPCILDESAALGEAVQRRSATTYTKEL
jgi:hypothetical protein